MKSYDQFCPVAKAATIFCERWTALILRSIAMGCTHFSELQRGVPLMSPSLLSKRLSQLQKEGVVERRRSDSGKVWTYHLTEAGEEFVPIVKALGIWGQHWTRRELEDNEISLEVLLWGMECGCDPDAFGGARTVVQIEFSDQPAGKRFWWLLNEDGRVELCIDDPGYDIGLYLTTTVPDMIYVWRGDVPLAGALEDGRIEAHGSSQCLKALSQWLKLSHFASYKSKRPAAAAAG